MTSSSPNDTLRAQTEKSFFLSNCSVLSGDCFRAQGSLQTQLFLELAETSELICASRERDKVHLVFPTPSIAATARDCLRSRGMETEPAPPPSTWDDAHWFGTTRLPEERLFFRDFLDFGSTASREADEYIHSFWNHNFAWYDLTRRIRKPSLGFFVIPRILGQVQVQVAMEEALLRSTLSNLEPDPEADAKLHEMGVQGEDDLDADETLVEAEAELASLLVTGTSDSANAETLPNASSKRQAPSPPQEPAPPHPDSPKRRRSSSTSPDLVETLHSTLPTISISSPSEAERGTSQKSEIAVDTDTISRPPPPNVQPQDAHPGESATPVTMTTHLSRPPSPLPARPSDFAARSCLPRSNYLPSTPSRSYKSLENRGRIHTCLRIPKIQAGQVVGHKGEYVKRIQETSKVDVLVEDSLRTDYSVVHLVGGTIGQANQAIAMIKSKARTWRISWEADDNYISLS